MFDFGPQDKTRGIKFPVQGSVSKVVNCFRRCVLQMIGWQVFLGIQNNFKPWEIIYDFIEWQVKHYHM
jgi:hypothetical protein